MTNPSAASPLQMLEQVCDDIFERWDKDMRSGKLLTALAGRLERYDPRVTAIRAALAAAAAHDARVTELLEANNREVERRRTAQATAASLLSALQKAISTLEAMEDEAWPETTEALIAARAAIAATEQPTHRHVKRGSAYRLLFRHGQVQSGRPIFEGDTLVTYLAADGSVWHRPPEEFDDGRFEQLGTTSTAGSAEG